MLILLLTAALIASDARQASVERWKPFDAQAIDESRKEAWEENLSMGPEGYEPLTALSASGDAEAAYRLFLLHQDCKHNAVYSEADLARRLENLNVGVVYNDEQLGAEREAQIRVETRRYEMCMALPRDHSLKAYRFLSAAAARRYPPAIRAFLTDARNLIRDEVFRQPDLVQTHLIALASVVAEAELSGDPTILWELSREYSYRGTYGTNIEKRYLYTYLASLAASDPGLAETFLNMVEAVEDKIAPEKLKAIRAQAEALCAQSCRH